MSGVTGWIPTPSARQAAWLLAGMDPPPPAPIPTTPVSTGETERMELVNLLAARIRTCDAAELAVCRRLLEHLRGPQADRMPTLRRQ